MSTKTAVQSVAPIRRRLPVLDRAHSSVKLSHLPTSEMKHASTGNSNPSSPTDNESSDEGKEPSEDDEEEDDKLESKRVENSLNRPTISTRNLRRQRDRSPMSPRSRAWYEFDLAVVVALVSPIGNWLTGGDHIKNLLLIALLIFYLHQIIETPWTLYQKAKPRIKAHHMPLIDPDTPEGRFAALAASELQKWELFYLFLAFMSPFLGASLLRYVTATILGPDAISWFSAGLFVLATGVRPWAHVIDRFNQRTEELHNFIHYPSNSRCVSEENTTHLEERVAKLEKSLNKMKTKIANVTDDLYDYVDDTVDAVEVALIGQDRKWDKHEIRIKDVEQTIGRLQTHKAYHFLAPNIQAYLKPLSEYICPIWPRSQKSLSSRAGLPPHSPSSSSQLETIVEEDYNSETEKYPILARPYSITSSLIYRIGSFAFLPLRAIGRMVLGTY